MGWYEQTKSFIRYYTSVCSENTWFWNYGRSLTSILGQILFVHQVSSLYWSQGSCDNLYSGGLCPFVHNSRNNQIAAHIGPWLRDHHSLKCSADSKLDRVAQWIAKSRGWLSFRFEIRLSSGYNDTNTNFKHDSFRHSGEWNTEQTHKQMVLNRRRGFSGEWEGREDTTATARVQWHSARPWPRPHL